MKRLLLIIAGCAPPLIVGGHSMYASDWIDSQQQVRQRASFELSCPSDQLDLVPLVTYSPGAKYDYAKQIGVTGCGHRLVYVRPDMVGGVGWVLNSSDAQPK